MGDLAQQTAVTPALHLDDPDPTTSTSRHFTATLHDDWEIWGPEGGYVAAVALRAAGAASSFARPASFFCHYLAVASFAPVDLVVTPLRSGRTVLSQRVEMTQEGRPILSAMVWSVGQVEGLVHRDLRPPDVPNPDQLRSPFELWPDRKQRFKFWDNFDQRPIDFYNQWPPDAPAAPEWRSWARTLAPMTSPDPWIDAARTLILLDVLSWPAGSRPHAYLEPPFIAPSLDLYAAFQHFAIADQWLLLDGHSPVADDGLLSWTGRIWNLDRQLVASGGGQAVFRHT